MKKEKVKILLVEDDTNLGFLIMDFLEANSFDVKLYRDGESGLNGFCSGRFDFCILDVMLPNMDGFSLAEAIRKEDKSVPIIFLTARSMKEDKIKGFRLGIDDYITKPFDEEELLYRIYAILNRVNLSGEPAPKSIYEIGEFGFDSLNQQLIYKGEKKRLTNKESEILKILSKSKNNIVKREDIMMAVWGDTDYFIGRSLDVFISKLRRYLSSDSSVKIEVIPTVGLVLSDE